MITQDVIVLFIILLVANVDVLPFTIDYSFNKKLHLKLKLNYSVVSVEVSEQLLLSLLSGLFILLVAMHPFSLGMDDVKRVRGQCYQ